MHLAGSRGVRALSPPPPTPSAVRPPLFAVFLAPAADTDCPGGWRGDRESKRGAAEEGSPAGPWRAAGRRAAAAGGHAGLCDGVENLLRARGDTGSPPETCAAFFDRLAALASERDCLGERRILRTDHEWSAARGIMMEKLTLGAYEFLSYAEVHGRVDAIARALSTKLGVGRGQRVAIYGNTHLDWVCAAHAVWKAGGTVVTVYASLGLEALAEALAETEAHVIFAEAALLPALSSIADSLPAMKSVVSISGDSEPAFNLPGASVQDIEELAMSGRTLPELKIQAERQENLAVIMYTSGTTGAPKGVMLSHGNILAAVGGLAEALLADPNFSLAAMPANPSYLAFLPSAHIFELVIEFVVLALGMRIGFSSPTTFITGAPRLQKGEMGDAAVLKPSTICVVPAILDRVKARAEDHLKTMSFLARTIFQISMVWKTFWACFGFFRSPLIDAVVFRKIRSVLGGNVIHMACGSAPLHPQTNMFCQLAFGAPIVQGYGLTESCAIGTVMSSEDGCLGRVGGPINSCEIKLCDWEEGNYLVSDKPNPRGEVAIAGPAVSAGYFKKAELTAQNFRTGVDGKTWFYTGDIAEIHSDGVFKIVDRKKDLSKLQGGEYVSLGKVESILSRCQFVERAMVYARSTHNYCVAVIMPNAASLRAIDSERFGPADPLELLVEDELILKEVKMAIIDTCKASKLAKFEIPAQILLVADDWTVENELLTAAMKLKRQALKKKYDAELDKLYS